MVGHCGANFNKDVAIRELAEIVRDVAAPELELAFDRTKPDGMPRKLLDVTRLNELGWRHRIELRPGIEATYQWFLVNQKG